MSSISVACAATSAFVPVPVVSREIIHTGAVVQERIPLDAVPGEFDQDGEHVSYLQFARTVPGGRVNVFVHTDSMDLFGRTVLAHATLWKKTLGDGREFFYVDLKPIAEEFLAEMSATRRLIVMDRNQSTWSEDDGLIFSTPDPLRGLVIFVPPEAKMPNRQKIAPRPAAAKTEDSQLARLLSEGWKIEHEFSDRVELYRMKGDVRRTMTHHRPKQKKQGRK